MIKGLGLSSQKWKQLSLFPSKEISLTDGIFPEGNGNSHFQIACYSRALTRKLLAPFCVLLILFAALSSVQAEENEDKSDALTRDEVKEIVLTQLGAWASGDKEAFQRTLHPDVVFAWPGKRFDFDAVSEAFDGWVEAFKDTNFELHKAIIEGNNFAIEYRFSSTRRSNGKRHSTGTVAIGSIKDGKIIVIKEYLDGRVSRLQEAGELPVDEGEEPFPWPDTPESRIP